MTRSRVLAPVILALCVVVASCSDDNVGPTPTPTPTVTPAPQVSRIQATAPPTMAAVGDTVKLSLTAFYTNGNSRDVAAEAVWTVNMPSVVRITNGEATALSLGATFVQVRFDRFNSSVKIQVTPPGTFAIVGGTREPGSSGLPGVTVTHPSSGLSTVSDAQGSFTMGGLMDRTVVLQKAGFEDATYTVIPEDFQWLAVQRQIRIQEGETRNVQIAPHDMDYAPPYASASGERCSPCKLIRLTNTPGTRLRVSLKWTPVSIGLKLWNDDGTFVQTSPGLLEREIFSDKGEVWLYVGQNPNGANLTYVDVQVIVTKIGL
jgi:hypothetical protein